MIRYKNLSGDSGVAEFEPGSDFIKVRFNHSNAVYVYTVASAGPSHITEMNRLAGIGQGLATYIAQNTRKLYERKE
jgi:hypothetical protein